MKERSTTDLHMKAVLGVIVYLIIAFVLVMNNQFLHEVVAKSGSDDSTVRGTKKVLATPAQGGSHHPSQHQTSDLSPTGSKKSAPIPSTSSDLPPPAEDLATQEGGRGGNGDSNDQATFRHNAQDIAMELSGLTPEEIKQYPITDLSNSDIILILGFLDPGNLTKVLLHIPQQDLITIEHRLTHHDFDEYLNRLSESDRTQVEDRLMSTSGSSLN